MRVFLTGGTGFVGSYVADQLVAKGHDVVALVRETSDTAHLMELGVELVVGALGAAEDFGVALEEAQAVIHVAGMTTARDRRRLYDVNVVGTRDLVDRCAERLPSGARFIYISSVSAQGPSKGRGPRARDKKPRPVSAYGDTKLEGEGAVLAHRDHLAVTILRPPPVYGPRDRDMYEVFRLANRRITPILGGPRRWLSVIHGEDLGRAVVACLQAPGQGEIYPVDDGHVYTWEDLVGAIADGVGKRALKPRLPKAVFACAAAISEVGGGVLNMTATFTQDKYVEMIQESWVCGNEAICADLGWSPRWNLADGARQTAQWYRAQGWL